MYIIRFFLFVFLFYNFNREAAKINKQDNIFSIEADHFEAYKNDEKKNIFSPYEKFSGNVRINNKQFSISSDFAKTSNNEDEKVFLIYKNVEIKKKEDTLTINADNVDFYTQKKRIYIKGNVNCKKGEIFFQTNNCEYNVEQNTIQYEDGGCFIKDDSNENEKIFLNSTVGYCNLDNSSVVLTKDIEIKNKDCVITCNKVIYNANENEVRCSGDLKINMNNRKGEYITTEEDCIYNTKKKSFYINKGLYHTPKQLIYGENLVFDQKEDIVSVDNGIEILMWNKIRFTCQKCIYNVKKQHGELRGDTVIYNSNSSKDNFLYLYANFFTFDIIKNSDFIEEEDQEDELDLFSVADFEKEEIINKTSDSTQKNHTTENVKKKNKGKNKDEMKIVIKGNGDVCVCTNNFQCRSDTIHFNGYDIFFPNDTLIWNQKNMMFGKSVKIRLIDNGIDKITINSQPFILIIDDLNFYNQVSGEKMIANIVNNNIDKALFINNIDTFYYLLSENKLTGVNRLKCSKFCAVFDSNSKLKKILFDNQISGNFFFPDYVENNKQNLVLDRFVEKSEFIKNTTQPNLEKIKEKINITSFIPEEEKKKLFERENISHNFL